MSNERGPDLLDLLAAAVGDGEVGGVEDRQQLLDERLGGPLEMLGLLARPCASCSSRSRPGAGAGRRDSRRAPWPPGPARGPARARRRPRRPRWPASSSAAGRRRGGIGGRAVSRFVGAWRAASAAAAGSPGRPLGWASWAGRLMPLMALLVDDLGVDDLVVVGCRPGRARAAGPRRSRRRRTRWPPPARRAACRAPGRRSPASRSRGVMPSMSPPARASLSDLRSASTRSFSAPENDVGLVLQHLLGLVDEAVGLVADLGLLPAPAVVLGVGLGVADHPVDVVLGRATTGR